MADVDFDTLLALVRANERYKRNIEYGEPRSGHPEGAVKRHISDLERNLQLIRSREISDVYRAKLLFLIHVHDSFKAESESGVSMLDPKNHASIARCFAEQFTNDRDVLSILQYHDLNFYLWNELSASGRYDSQALEDALQTIEDIDLYLMFTIIDGRTAGKDYGKIVWFINEVRKRRASRVDESWIDPL